MSQSSHTICIGLETLEKLARREAVTFTMEDGVSFTLIDADTFPRGLIDSLSADEKR